MGQACLMAEPRLRPVRDPTPDQAEVMPTVLSAGGAPLNIFATMAHHPKLAKRYLVLGTGLLGKGQLPAREREIVILRVGADTGSVYEFGQHTRIGRDVGLTDDEIARLVEPDGGEGWTDDELALIRMTDELCADDVVSDATWTDLARRWSDAELVELLLLVGFYRMTAGFLNSARVELDDGVPGWPAST
jgi:alkylhydroperoxidase family enzyme